MTTAERTRDLWRERAAFATGAEWPVRVDEYVVEEPERWVQSACVLCSNGCGMDIGVRDGRISSVLDQEGPDYWLFGGWAVDS